MKKESARINQTINDLIYELKCLCKEIGDGNIYQVVEGDTLRCVFGVFCCGKDGIYISTDMGYRGREKDYRGNTNDCHIPLPEGITNYGSFGNPHPNTEQYLLKYQVDVNTAVLDCRYVPVELHANAQEVISTLRGWLSRGIIGRYYNNPEYCYYTSNEYRKMIDAATKFAKAHPDLWNRTKAKTVTQNQQKKERKVKTCPDCGRGQFNGNKFCPECGASVKGG